MTEEEKTPQTEPEETALEDETMQENGPAAADEEGTNETETPDDEISALQAEIERLEAESHEYLDGWQRARAEFINFKRRTSEENSKTRARLAGDILSRFLEVIDDLNLALENRPEEEELDSWIAGVELIHQKFMMILQSEGVEAISVEEGTRFDPTLHDAVTYEENEDHEEGEIISVIKQGYKLNERVLRPVQVRVAK